MHVASPSVRAANMSQFEPINHNPRDPWWALVILIGATGAALVWIGAVTWIVVSVVVPILF
jgi:hypothetical protein